MSPQYEFAGNSGQPQWPESNNPTLGNNISFPLDQDNAPPIKLGPMLNPPDYLGKAVKSTEGAPLSKPGTPLARPDTANGSSPDITSSGDSQAAKNKLSQEALLADPGQMRKVFPTLMKDLGLKPNGYLNMSEIDVGLKSPNLSQDDKNLLTVFRAGYTKFNQENDFKGTLKTDTAGISADSLTILDKAMNRNITEDPILADEKMIGWLEVGSGVGLSAARISGYFNATSPYSVYIGLGSAVAGALIFELAAEAGWLKSLNDPKYDQEKKAYNSFVDDFEKGHPQK